MVNPIIDLNQKEPLTIADLLDDSNVLPIAQYTLQLQLDTLNVVENRVPLDSFTPERQQEIKSYYQYSACYSNAKNPNIAKRTPDTLDIV